MRACLNLYLHDNIDQRLFHLKHQLRNYYYMTENEG